MVMPCSRSARSPSVTKERSTSSRPRRSAASESASSWSSKSWRVSKSSRPIRVLFPSSTDPMVAKRSRSMVSAPSSGPPAGGELGCVGIVLEVPLALAVLHGRLGEAVVAPGGLAHGGHLDGLVALGLDPLALGQEHAVALDDPAFMGVVDRRQGDALTADVLPDVELGEVREREGAQVLARPHAALVELPQFGALPLGVPLAERVPEGEHPLLRPGLVLVASG